MFPFTFGAPALEELAALDWLNTPHTCYLAGDAAVRVEGETAFVDSGRRAACRKQGLTSFHVFCRKLQSVAPRKLYRVAIFSLFLTVFYVTLVFRFFAVSLCHYTVFEDRLKWPEM